MFDKSPLMQYSLSQSPSAHANYFGETKYVEAIDLGERFI